MIYTKSEWRFIDSELRKILSKGYKEPEKSIEMKRVFNKYSKELRDANRSNSIGNGCCCRSDYNKRGV